MKYIILSSLTIFLSNVCLAGDYQIKYFLDNHSIKLLENENTTPITPSEPEPTPQPICLYDHPNSYWLAGRNSAYNVLQMFYQGETLLKGKGYGLTEMSINGVTYTRGNFVAKQGDYDRYYICKQPS